MAGLVLLIVCGNASESEVGIGEIQGDGQRSPLAGQVVTTRGVVTLLTADGRHFWLQDPEGDGNPATSDGILVSDVETLSEKPRVSDLVTLQATVEEEQHGDALPRTRLISPFRLTIISRGNTLPSPVELAKLPEQSIPEGIAFWEPLEGMRVAVSDGTVVAPTSRHGELVLLTKDDARPGSGYDPGAKQIFLRSLGGGDVDYNPERILVDDQSLDEPLVVAPGDVVRDLVGVVDYSFGNYKIQPAGAPVIERADSRRRAQAGKAKSGETILTTFNVNNLFDLEDDPSKEDERTTPTAEELETKLEKLARALEAELSLPDILVVQEVENTEILQRLGDRVNRSVGTEYRATSFDASDGRSIEVGFLWDAARVTLEKAFLLSGPDVEDAFGRGSPAPGREPLVGILSIGDERITIIGNHFKSKRGDDPLFGVNQPPDRPTEQQRKAQARVVRRFVDSLLEKDPEAPVMVIGDLNDFPFEEPGEGSDHAVAILEGDAPDLKLTNLVHRVPEGKRFTSVYQGNSEVLDHILVSSGLLKYLTAVDILHFNTSYPEFLENDRTTSHRASDHDPVEARFDFAEK
jgi:predicted extracellular nuclease